MSIQELEKTLGKEFTKKRKDFDRGCIVKVHYKIREKDKVRIHPIEGIVLKRQGQGHRQSFTIRRISYGQGMEITFPLIYTAILLTMMTVFLVKEWLAPEIVVFGVLVFFLLGQVISLEEAFAGFSNIGVLTIALLFVVAGSLQTTGALNYLTPYIFGNSPDKPRRKLTRLLFPTSLLLTSNL